MKNYPACKDLICMPADFNAPSNVYARVHASELCLEHISYITSGRNSKFGVWIHLGYRSVAYCFQVPVTLTSVLEKSCLEHIYYIIRGRNPKFGVWIHLGVTDCAILFFGSL